MISSLADVESDNNVLVVTEKIRVPLKELQFTYVRSQGPGGQNVNKLNTKAVMRWAVVNNETLPDGVRLRFLERHKHRITNDGDLILTSQRFRDRGRNIEDCLEKLRQLISDVAVAPTKRKSTKPTKGSKRRRRKSKEENAQKKKMRKPPKFD